MSPNVTRFFDYNKALIERARDNRKVMNMAERRMWYEIVPNLPFTIMRQRVIGNYIADFYCASKMLVIEVDGDSHYTDDAQGYDRIRTDYFESLGIQVIRYTNDEVLGNPDEVLKDLLRVLGG
jgi:very-short-patch-repair endonuclease